MKHSLPAFDPSEIASLNPANQEVLPPLEPSSAAVTNVRAVSRPRARTPSADTLVQYSFDLRKILRRDMGRIAEDNDMTIRALVLVALRDRFGLKVREEDLLDRRKRQ